MQPKHIHFYIFVPVPVHPEFGRDGLVGPEIRVGEPRGEDLFAEAQFADAPDDLPGARTDVGLLVWSGTKAEAE